MNRFSTRFLLNLGGLSAFGLLVVGLYMQHVELMPPCPLCVIQRYAFLAIGVFALLGAAFCKPGRAPGARNGATVLGLLAALSGAGVAAYNVWIQAHPSFSCGIDPMETSLNTFFTARWMPWLFKADGLCSTEFPPIFGLSMPMWALIWFGIYTVASLYLLIARRK